MRCRQIVETTVQIETPGLLGQPDVIPLGVLGDGRERPRGHGRQAVRAGRGDQLVRVLDAREPRVDRLVRGDPGGQNLGHLGGRVRRLVLPRVARVEGRRLADQSRPQAVAVDHHGRPHLVRVPGHGLDRPGPVRLRVVQLGVPGEQGQGVDPGVQFGVGRGLPGDGELAVHPADEVRRRPPLGVLGGQPIELSHRFLGVAERPGQEVVDDRGRLFGLADVPEDAAGQVVPEPARPPAVAGLGVVEPDAQAVDLGQQARDVGES